MVGVTGFRPPSEDDVRRAVSESGFPFELRVAHRFLQLGFHVQPSHRFFDRVRARDAELDLLATKQLSIANLPSPVASTLQIAVQCKDNSLPYVCFGLPGRPPTVPGTIHPDFRYCHVNTTGDRGFPNGFALFAMTPAIREEHHQLSAEQRYYLLATLEARAKNGPSFRLHVPEALRHSLTRLGLFADDFHSKWIKLSSLPELSRLLSMPAVFICFLMLVHSGTHYRFENDTGAITEAPHTSVFLSCEGPETSVAFVVDVVRFDRLAEVVAQVERSHSALAARLAPILLAQRRPR